MSDVFAETAKGGRYARRNPVLGEAVGDALVVARLEKVGGHQLWSVRCGCGAMQIRTSGQINSALRTRRPLACPECVAEYRRGSADYAREERQRDRLDRVLEGGPVWSIDETQSLCDGVMADLEAEYGSLPEPTLPLPIAVAVGWPYSARDTWMGDFAMRYAREEAAHRKSREAFEYKYAQEWGAREQARADSAAKRAAKQAAVQKINAEKEAAAIERRRSVWMAVQQGANVVDPDKIKAWWGLRSKTEPDRWWMDIEKNLIFGYRQKRNADGALSGLGVDNLEVSEIPFEIRGHVQRGPDFFAVEAPRCRVHGARCAQIRPNCPYLQSDYEAAHER